MRRLIFIVPVLLFLGMAVVFLMQLKSGKDASVLPSNLIDRPVPPFAMEALPGRGRPLASEHLVGEVTLVNIFGSWCVACLAEHPFLMEIQRAGEVPLHGIDWRDDPADGMAWLQRHGDPYDRVGADPESKVAIDFGVTGAPETFVVDASGTIRYKHIGPITPQIWEETLMPLIRELRKG